MVFEKPRVFLSSALSPFFLGLVSVSCSIHDPVVVSTKMRRSFGDAGCVLKQFPTWFFLLMTGRMVGLEGRPFL